MRSLAYAAQGILDADHALEWAINVGYLVVQEDKRGQPDELVLTRKGAVAVFVFWKAWDEAQREKAA